MKTAEEFLENIGVKTNQNGLNTYLKGDVKHAMIEFAKMHVEEALKKASKKATISYEYSGNTGSEYCDEFVNKQSILNAYPLENIK